MAFHADNQIITSYIDHNNIRCSTILISTPKIDILGAFKVFVFFGGVSEVFVTDSAAAGGGGGAGTILESGQAPSPHAQG